LDNAVKYPPDPMTAFFVFLARQEAARGLIDRSARAPGE
jgi:hypothetical protein